MLNQPPPISHNHNHQISVSSSHGNLYRSECSYIAPAYFPVLTTYPTASVASAAFAAPATIVSSEAAAAAAAALLVAAPTYTPTHTPRPNPAATCTITSPTQALPLDWHQASGVPSIAAPLMYTSPVPLAYQTVTSTLVQPPEITSTVAAIQYPAMATVATPYEAIPITVETGASQNSSTCVFYQYANDNYVNTVNYYDAENGEMCAMGLVYVTYREDEEASGGEPYFVETVQLPETEYPVQQTDTLDPTLVPQMSSISFGGGAGADEEMMENDGEGGAVGGAAGGRQGEGPESMGGSWHTGGGSYN